MYLTRTDVTQVTFRDFEEKTDSLTPTEIIFPLERMKNYHLFYVNSSQRLVLMYTFQFIVLYFPTYVSSKFIAVWYISSTDMKMMSYFIFF